MLQMYSFGMNANSNIENTNSANITNLPNIVQYCRTEIENLNGDRVNGVSATQVAHLGSSPPLQNMISPSSSVNTRRTHSYIRARNNCNNSSLVSSDNANTNISNTHLTR